MIDVHHVHTPNGHKVSIMLEEVGLPHRIFSYSIFEGRQLEPSFRSINPNGRFPAIVDHTPIGGGPPFAVFESGAILVYLAEKTGQLMPTEPRAKSLAMQWLMWQMAGLGPMQGQAHHFIRYAPESLEYPIHRYVKEVNRLMDVMNFRLGQAKYLAGDQYSVADIACWPWIRSGRILDITIGNRANLERWYHDIAERPAVIKGAALPEGSMLAGPPNQKVDLSPEQWSNVFGEKMLAAAKQ
jgi:GST-like protein